MNNWGRPRFISAGLVFVGAVFLAFSAFLPLKVYERITATPDRDVRLTMSARGIGFQGAGLDRDPYGSDLNVYLLIVTAVLLFAGAIVALTAGKRLAGRILWIGALVAVGIVGYVGLQLVSWTNFIGVGSQQPSDVSVSDGLGFWMLLAAPVLALAAAVLAKRPGRKPITAQAEPITG